MINNVVLVGRLTRDAELRYTGSGIAVASFTVAVERPYTNAQGERETDFINCVAWRKTAEIISNYTRKGSLVGVTGRMQTRNYTNNEGRKVYITEVVCENFQMLEPKSVTERRAQNDGSSSNSGFSNNSSNNKNYSQNTNQAPKNNSKSSYANFDEDPFDTNNDSIDISDDDLPF
ncbi:MAG: single-stranded DNA-binding protein [Alkalibacterium gilvum]|uniref:Single-stranded DNA-binding protein n=1 Tax=Alkalibacterium gilvum TaxID=1130080 RepID=A0A1H6S8Y6_9LACT|nr:MULTISPECIES: single-stranded DNA-binding protein [Alkalibacterium]MDN6293167.1 single-stranded DNA-binding protein [Alkalibacterium sp.]MDN6294808.1 single-stranded DNA-binding protein [Alkalibacterium sp.]MDN6398075.1 single-stranded DNA-binding protein [Alkalibacterium sp.]MDN6729662.1 single-stranded DNA-binding protein [Alkalibacterium sp.]SEI64391.1 single-strand DNA-binding protein [Alkalibacterium gilvum]